MGVLGMGGLFFRADDPEGLAAWYKQMLGVGAGCDSVGDGNSSDGDAYVWRVQGGPMVFQPFARDTDYFAADKGFMLNFRVSGLDALLDELRAAGVEVTTKDEWNDEALGRFARIHDPEGNPIELWEPPVAG